MKTIHYLTSLVACGAICCLTSCKSEQSSSAPQEEVVENMDTMARDFASQVKVTLDVTRVEDLVSQIPIQAQMSRGSGEDRIYKWRFDDGSAMVAYFRPAPGHQNGLLLHRVGFEN